MKLFITRQTSPLRLTEIANTPPLQCHALSGLSEDFPKSEDFPVTLQL